jgi:hypothetical protein
MEGLVDSGHVIELLLLVLHVDGFPDVLRCVHELV